MRAAQCSRYFECDIVVVNQCRLVESSGKSVAKPALQPLADFGVFVARDYEHEAVEMAAKLSRQRERVPRRFILTIVLQVVVVVCCWRLLSVVSKNMARLTVDDFQRVNVSALYRMSNALHACMCVASYSSSLVHVQDMASQSIYGHAGHTSGCHSSRLTDSARDLSMGLHDLTRTHTCCLSPTPCSSRVRCRCHLSGHHPCSARTRAVSSAASQSRTAFAVHAPCPATALRTPLSDSKVP